MSNMVRTAKYKYYDFLPKFLWEEFNPATKIANVYFLFIAALQVRYVSIERIITTFKKSLAAALQVLSFGSNSQATDWLTQARRPLTVPRQP